MKPLAIFLLLLLGLDLSLGQSPTPSPSNSASPPPSSQTPSSSGGRQIWRCESAGGVCEVAVNSIVSVSSHEYTVDAISRVVEVNVDTTGNMALRFYYIEPKTPAAPGGVGQSAIDRAKDVMKDIAGRSGQDDVTKRAAKTYPTTTHTHTVEYRLASEDQAKQVLASALNSFRTGGSATLSLP